MNAKPSTNFEHEVCSRCGGTGEFSYNPRDNKRCLRCNGSGWVLTKRGGAAQAYFTRLLSKPASEVAIGDMVKDDLSGWQTVVSIRNNSEGNTFDVTYANGGCFHNVPADMLFRVAFTAEQKSPLLAQALAYQESLTKSGAPRK